MTHYLTALAALVLAAHPAQACDFNPWFTFKGTPLLRDADTGAYFYVTDHKAADADGAPNAYHPGDVGKNCISADHIGLDCPANAGFPGTSWWDSVLIADPADPSRPFVQTNGEFAGFFVSATWLFAPSISDRTDPARYVDATRVAYLVMPGNEFPALRGTGFKGDVGFAVNLANNLSTPLSIADRGGGADARLGEGSLALWTALGGQDVNPRTGAGLPAGDVLYVIFPNSRNDVDVRWPRETSDIAAQVSDLLDRIGGLDAVRACL